MNIRNESNSLVPLYDKKLKCIYCDKEFTSKKVRSQYVRPKLIDSDYGPFFDKEDYNPLYYYVKVCPHCGFTFSEDFEENLSAFAKARVDSEIIKKKWAKSDYCGNRTFSSAVIAFKMAIYTGELINEKHIVLANLCIRLAWIYRNEGILEEEMRFMKLAAKEYEESYLNSDFNQNLMSEMLVLYFIGETNRKIGNYNEAIKYFNKIIEHPEKGKYVKYVNKARRQWEVTVEQYKNDKKLG
ncbi:MAG: DUF2225 domain-containing protein [Eubacteriales bacterium]